MGLPTNGTRGKQRAWQPAPYGNQYDNCEDTALAFGRTVVYHSRVGNPDLGGCSRNKLKCPAGEKSGPEDREGSPFFFQPLLSDLLISNLEVHVRRDLMFGL